MTYEVIILGHLHMPLYFIGTFTEYSELKSGFRGKVYLVIPLNPDFHKGFSFLLPVGFPVEGVDKVYPPVFCVCPARSFAVVIQCFPAFLHILWVLAGIPRS